MRVFAGFILLLFAGSVLAADRCAICGGEVGTTVYIMTDKVTGEKKDVCNNCGKLTRTCFVCGLPVKVNFTKLADGRFLCERDAKNAVLNEDEAKKVCEEVQDALDRLFSRFLTFPATNVETAIVDRVNLLELFKVPGNDYECPNVLGYIQSKTNNGQIRHDISLLGALPRGEFKAVCAHEFSHAWLFENVPAVRKRKLGHDANEAFCELVAYMLMDSQQEEDEKKAIRRNAYTRGQIDLFIEAERRFGFNDVMEWMKYGVDAVLHSDDLDNVRNIELPPSTTVSPTNLPTYKAETSRNSDDLVLRGISWNQSRPLAVINDRTFGAKEEGKVRVGGTNLVIRCLEIRSNSVVVQARGSAVKQELFMLEQ